MKKSLQTTLLREKPVTVGDKVTDCRSVSCLLGAKKPLTLRKAADLETCGYTTTVTT